MKKITNNINNKHITCHLFGPCSWITIKPFYLTVLCHYGMVASRGIKLNCALTYIKHLSVAQWQKERLKTSKDPTCISEWKIFCLLYGMSQKFRHSPTTTMLGTGFSFVIMLRFRIILNPIQWLIDWCYSCFIINCLL